MNDNINELGFSMAELPDIITTQYNDIYILNRKVEEAYVKAQSAKDSADTAYRKSAGIGKKKEAIYSLQNAAKELAEAQIQSTEAQRISFEFQQKLSEITKYLFALGVSNITANRIVVRELELKLQGASEEQLSDLARQELNNVIHQLKLQEDMMNKQTKMADILKQHDAQISINNENLSNLNAFLFTNNKEISSLKLSSAQHEKFMKMQEKNLAIQSQKQSDLAEALKQQDQEIDKLKTASDDQKKLINIQGKNLVATAQRTEEIAKLVEERRLKDILHDEELLRQSEKDKEHDRLLEERRVKDHLQDKELERQSLKDKEHDRLLEEKRLKDESQDEELARQFEKDKEHDTKIQELYNKYIELESIINDKTKEINEINKEFDMVNAQKANKLLAFISLAIGMLGLIISIIHFFI